MRRSVASFVAFALLVLGVAGSVGGAAEPASKEAEVNGVRLPYVEQGSGTPVVLVHAALSDLRDWEAVREALARNHRVVAYTQRYHGTAPWPDDGRSFDAATHADDLAKFISVLDAGPVHLVGWSYGGSVAAVAATNNPRLVRSLVLYEPNLASVLAPDSAGAKQAAAEAGRMFGPAVEASKTGDNVQAVFRLIEGALPLQPGEAARQPERWQARWRDNARTVPLLFAAPPPSVSCDALRTFARPTLVVVGQETKSFFPVIAERVRECVPGAERVVLRGVGHGAPLQDPAAFSDAVHAFVSKH